MKIIGQTDIGQIREGNEDSLGYDLDRQIGVVADGMGGLNAGEVAAVQAVDAFLQAMPPLCTQQAMQSAIEAANTRVFDLARTHRAWQNMGTTLVACGLDSAANWVIGHVGDSRAYLLRDTTLQRLTKDHSVVQEMVDEGLMSPADARMATNRHIITRAIGLEAAVSVTLQELPSQPGDLVLLCSDGLSDAIADEAIGNLLTQRESMEGAAAQLVAAANRAGGVDNITVLLVSL